MKLSIVLPRQECERLETVRELFIGQQRGPGLLCACASEGDSQVVCEEAKAVEDDALFAIGTSQQAMNFIDHEHAYIHLLA